MKKRVGRGTRKMYIGLVSYETYVPDASTFKTLQITLGGWVKVNHEFEQYDYDKIVTRTKHRIKEMLRIWARTNGYREGSIVDIHIPKVPTKNEDRTYQYMKVEVCIYPQNVKYEKYYCSVVTENLTRRIIDVLDDFPEVWTFTKSIKKPNV